MLICNNNNYNVSSDLVISCAIVLHMEPAMRHTAMCTICFVLVHHFRLVRLLGTHSQGDRQFGPGLMSPHAHKYYNLKFLWHDKISHMSTIIYHIKCHMRCGGIVISIYPYIRSTQSFTPHTHTYSTRLFHHSTRILLIIFLCFFFAVGVVSWLQQTRHKLQLQFVVGLVSYALYIVTSIDWQR